MEISREGCPALRVVMFPKDTNPSGNIFGGVILSHIDVAAGIAARSVTKHRVVTRSFKEAEFKKPVKIGDILTCWALVTRVGTTSISTHVLAEVERDGQYIPVTEAEVVYVAVDEHDRPIPVNSPKGTQGGSRTESAPLPSGTGAATAGDTNPAGGSSCADKPDSASSAKSGKKSRGKGKSSGKKGKRSGKKDTKDKKKSRKKSKNGKSAAASGHPVGGCSSCKR